MARDEGAPRRHDTTTSGQGVPYKIHEEGQRRHDELLEEPVGDEEEQHRGDGKHVAAQQLLRNALVRLLALRAVLLKRLVQLRAVERHRVRRRRVRVAVDPHRKGEVKQQRRDHHAVRELQRHTQHKRRA
jgi:hypothetical protein